MRTGTHADVSPTPLSAARSGDVRSEGVAQANGLGQAATGSVYVLDVDPDLAADLPPDEFETARARSQALAVEIVGPDWDTASIRQAARPDWLGLLVLRGVMIRQVSVGSRTACELFGPGDVIRPWDADGEYEPLPITVGWRVARVASLAILDAKFTHEICAWPTIVSRLTGRVATRARSLALGHAVSHLPRADGRLLILFWLLAERWGRVSPDGIRIGLPLTHDLIAMLVGVRRPTATLALQRLAEADLLHREGRETWRLTRAAQRYLHEPESLNLIDGAATT